MAFLAFVYYGKVSDSCFCHKLIYVFKGTSTQNPAGKCTYNVHTLYVQARTYGFGMDNIQNESFWTYEFVRT